MIWFFTVILGWIAEKLGNKIAIIVFRLAVFAAFLVIVEFFISGFFTSVITSLDSLEATVPDVVMMVWGWVMPSNARQCFVVIVSAHISKFFFVLVFRYFNMKARMIMTSVS